MSRSLRHGALAATAIAFSIAALSACGAGNDAQTLEVRPDNAAITSGDIKIQNANVITQPERDAEGPAVVAATLFNSGSKAQTLDSVALPGSGASVKLHAAKGSGPVVVPAGGRVILGGAGNASAVVENGREAVRNGNAQSVVFTFSDTGAVKLAAFVVPAGHYFKGFGPSALPATPSGTPGAPESGKPSGDASSSTTPGSPDASASDTTTPTDAASASQPAG